MYSAATVKRARTICRNVDSANSARTRKARATTAARKADPNAWKARDASKAQMTRIHALETALGYGLSPLGTFTAGEASDWYQTMKATIRNA